MRTRESIVLNKEDKKVKSKLGIDKKKLQKQNTVPVSPKGGFKFNAHSSGGNSCFNSTVIVGQDFQSNSFLFTDPPAV